ncbi:MAG TPA: glycosyltransferase, partial [Cryptosporangiaceae bacterium]|nr:glycosyltransferase [Cryptosporangiaceae bacterium]
MRWLAFGTYDVRRHPRVAVLIEGLRAHGDEVVEVNVPLPLDTAGRVAMLRQPWRLPLLAAKLLRCWRLLAIRARRERRNPPDAILVGYMGHFDVRLARLLFGRTPIALDHLVSAAGTAHDRGLAGSDGLKSRLMRRIDAGALGSADVVIVDTPEHEQALPAVAAVNSVVVPVGATEAWFAAGAASAGGPEDADGAGSRPLRAIFVGLFTPLHGTPALGEALAALTDEPGVEVTMVGTGQDHAACRERAGANPRVRWLNWVAGDELPALVAAHDVSLGIFGTTDKALKVVPTKVFQGAAAGCAIVTSDTPPQRAALGEAAAFVPPGDGVALADVLRRLAGDRTELA